MGKHGVFISYRHTDWALAGRIFDFLENKGLRPFWDATSMNQGDFPETLEREIINAPYFLCVLTPNTFGSMDSTDWVYREILIALEQPDKKILLLADNSFFWPENMPEEILRIKNQHYDTLDRKNFRSMMDAFCRTNIDWLSLSGIVDWRKRLHSESNIFMAKRELIEKSFAPLHSRFGDELVRSIKERIPFTGKHQLRYIHMSCYAASIIFASQQNMVDERAYDLGMMFKIFEYLLQDEEFSLEIVITAPGSFAAQDAIECEKLGNSALETCPEAVFLSAYCNICELIKISPIFAEAYAKKRFRFMVTENVPPYAIFQVSYKTGFEDNNHIKVDLYSEGLTSNMDRRCMMIFEADDPDNYKFFEQRYGYIRNPRVSANLIKQHHNQWMEQWNQIKEDL